MIKQVLSDMIDYFRSRMEKLSDYEKECAQTISSLNKPCQFYIVSSPNQAHHLLIKTHFPEFEDKSIRVMELHQDSFALQLKELIEDPMWANLERGSDSAYDVVQYSCPNGLGRAIVQFGRNVAHATYSKNIPDHSGLGIQMVLGKQMVVWELLGKIEKWDPKRQVDRIVDQYRQESTKRKEENAKNSSLKQLPETKTGETKKISDSMPGFGTYFYPSILIGDLDLTIEEQIFQKAHMKLAKNILVTTIGDMEMAVSFGGLVGIQTDDSEKAEKALNVIMAVALLFGLPAYFVRKSEIADIRFEKNTHEMRGSSWSVSGIRMQMFSSLASFGMNYQEVARTQISLNALNAIIKGCKKVWKEVKSQKSLELLLSGYTLLDGGSYSQSFITSWTIIERYLYDLWNDKLEYAKVNRKIREDWNRWPLHYVLEVLHVDRLITEDAYHDLRYFQKLRNDAIHEGYEITKEQATKCYEKANALVRKEAGVMDIIKPIRTVYC